MAPKKRDRRRLGARPYKNYTEEMLQLAVDMVKNKNCTSYDAEKQFGIPRRTIEKRVKNLHSDKPGPHFRLSSDEESKFVKVLIAAGDFGCPLSQLDLKLTVWDYLKKNNKTYIFNDKPPGDWWVKNFLQRYKDQLTLRSTQNITKARAQKTLEEFEEYFHNLKISLQDLPPSNIMNYDETNVSDDPGSTKSIFRRGIKYPERIINHSKGCISLMFAATAEGELLPPYVVYKSENLWTEWCRDGPEGARYNRSKSGWFDSIAFLDWFKNIVIPWASKLDGQKLIIGDNLSSHLNADVVELCEAHQIRFAFLPPRSTHLTQPLDVAFFGPLKKSWRTILLKYKTENPKQVSLNKSHFPLLLNQLMEAANLKKQNIISGFKATGIHPFNPYEVYKKLPEYEVNLRYDVDQTLLDYLKENKHPKPITRGKNTKLNVPSGKSISSSDITRLTTNKTTVKKLATSIGNAPANTTCVKARTEQKISGLKRPRKANTILAKKSSTKKNPVKKQKSRNDSSNSESSSSVPSCDMSDYDPKDDKDAAIDFEEWLDDEEMCSQVVSEDHGMAKKHNEKIANIEHKIVPCIDLEIEAKGNIINNIHKEDFVKDKEENIEGIGKKTKNKSFDCEAGTSYLNISNNTTKDKIPNDKRTGVKNLKIETKPVKIPKKKYKRCASNNTSTTSDSGEISIYSGSDILSDNTLDRTREKETDILNVKENTDFFSDISCVNGADQSICQKLLDLQHDNLKLDKEEELQIENGNYEIVTKEQNVQTTNCAMERAVQVDGTDTLVRQDTPVKSSENSDEKQKVTILSSVRFTPANRHFVGLETCKPLQLNKIDINFDVSKTEKRKAIQYQTLNKENIPKKSSKQRKYEDKQDNEEEKWREEYNIGDTVLARYYTKCWKYYVGVIENRSLKIPRKYSISYYKSVGKKENVKFSLPRRKDYDTVPNYSIVKKIELLQINDSPVEYVLFNDEDAIYF